MLAASVLVVALKLKDQMSKAASSDSDQSVSAAHFQSASFFSTHPPRPFDRVLVTGLGRSGTSAIGSLLHHCGYWMGEKDEINPRLRENVRLRKLIADRNYDEIHVLLEQWKGDHPKIGWKEPKLFLGKHRQFCESFSDDWLLIVVLRDPMAVSQRRMFVEGGSFLDTLLHVTAHQDWLCKYLLQRTKPTLVVSYEKFNQEPEASIGEIRDFLNTDDEADLSNATLWNRMHEDKLAYQEHARKKKAEMEESG